MRQGNDHNINSTILVLGGTTEARKLAALLFKRGARVTTSLAGRTKDPVLPAGQVRIGGFGGADGLAQWIADHRIEMVVDATHPYAAQISLNAVLACATAGVRLIRLERPKWEKPASAQWINVGSMTEAAATLPDGARVFLTIGRQDLAPFFGRSDCRFTARMIERPDAVPSDWQVITARGPFALDDEIALFEQHGFSHMVSKNAGGDKTRAKIDAAAHLSIPVVMVDRPDVPKAETVDTLDAVLSRLAKA